MGAPRRSATTRQSARRRARATVGWAAATLLGLNLALGGYMYQRPWFRDPVFDLKVRAMAERFAADPDAIRVVVLGSSRSAAAIEPATLETELAGQLDRPVRAFNLAMQGDGPIGQLIHLHRILDHDAAPDLVLIEILPTGFVWNVDRPYDFAVLRPDRITREEIQVVRRYGYPEAETWREWLETTCNPWYGSRFQLLARVQRLWLPTGVVTYHPQAARNLGWNAWDYYPPHLVRQRVEEVRRAYQGPMNNIWFGGPHAEAIGAMIAACQRLGRCVVVVVTPEGSEFRSWYPPRVASELEEFLSRLRTDYQVPVVNAREWLPDEAFVDSHHVARAWARPYTIRLVREVLATAWTECGARHRP